MDYFTDTQWENSHAFALGSSHHGEIDGNLSEAGNDLHRSHSEQQRDGSQPHLSDHSLHSDHSHHASHVQPHELEAQNIVAQDAEAQRYHDILLNDEFYSPQLSLHNTPLLSPHALTPLPASMTQDFTMPPAAVSSTHLTSHRRSSGKVTKQSPPTRWRNSSVPEDEFRLGDPALEEPVNVATIMDLAPRPQEDLDDRLRNAIAATSASSRSSSRRTSSVGSNSTRVTPRIRPRLGSSTDPSPLLAPNTPQSTTNNPPAVEDDVDQVFLKSNYRNLMDGTHKHLGFTAADRMTTELRAKKTVHKLAEQERRNRMNVAIAELSGVMGPHSDPSGPSKAATVERATQYIRKLHAHINDLEQRLANSEQSGATKSSSKSPGR